MTEIRPLLNLCKRENLLYGGWGEGMTLEEAEGRNVTGHEKRVEPGSRKSSGLPRVLISFLYLWHLLSSLRLSTELHPASKCSTEEKLIPTDSELHFSHTWIQRGTYPIFAPNMSIKPKMKVHIIFITEDLVVHNSIDFCAWCFEQLL